MLLLDGDDSFRPCELEHSYGIAAPSTLNEESIHGYQRSQLQRHTQARQLLFQKSPEDKIASAENTIEATISEDIADGQSALLDACLKLLVGDELELHVPSDELEEYEIHIIETAARPTNHALRDYQMQLMLLEQQNKKHLLMQRQMQRQGTQATVKKMAQKRPEVGTGPTTRKKTRVRKSESADDLGKETEPIEQEDPTEILPSHFELIYQVTCRHGSANTSNHPVPAFRDMPKPGTRKGNDSDWTVDSHLNGKIPIFNLENYMADDTDGIAFVVIRTIDCSETSVQMALAGVPVPYTEDVYIKSAIAKQAMETIATCYFDPANQQEIDPYRTPEPLPVYQRNRITPIRLFLFHHRSLLADYIAQNPASKSHIEALSQYMESRHGNDFAEAENLFTRQLVTKEHILKLYKPNELVISGMHGRPAAFVVHEWPKMNVDGWVTIKCWSFQTEGSCFVRKQSTLSILPLGSQPKQIQTLSAYPLQFATPEIRRTIAAHGEMQWKLRRTEQITYKGWNIKRDQYFPDARFMIDHTIYRKMHNNALAFNFTKPETTHLFDHMPAFVTLEEEPSTDTLLLLPPDIHGFYLNEKKWVHLFVDSIYPVSWNTKAYERLVLPSETKNLVEALVKVRSSQRGVKQGIGVSGKRTDITAGKGNGLIMLLHGGPGTGKTLTAESVAEIAEMPLYRVTCGDIGTSAEAVEKYLNTVLHLGKIWNCVLLLDEADVFLEERSMSDLKRNSLVSVFLRILEYYDGILILTSNRVGTFDEAFKSRIQVALHYEDLNRSARKKIWENFIEMLEEDEEDVNFHEIKHHLDDLAGKELNGRQIRNALTTARQLAIYKNERLEWEHLTQALSVSSNFSAYLKHIQGHTDEQRARDIGLR